MSKAQGKFDFSVHHPFKENPARIYDIVEVFMCVQLVNMSFTT